MVSPGIVSWIRPGIIWWTTPFAAVVVGVLLGAAACVDVVVRRLPNPLLGAAGVVTIMCVSVEGRWGALAVGLTCAGVTFAVGAQAARRFGAGAGDVKMAAVIALHTGAVDRRLPPLAIVIAGSITVIAAAISGSPGGSPGWSPGGFGAVRRRRPLGPALWLGWLAAELVAVAAGIGAER